MDVINAGAVRDVVGYYRYYLSNGIRVFRIFIIIMIVRALAGILSRDYPDRRIFDAAISVFGSP